MRSNQESRYISCHVVLYVCVSTCVHIHAYLYTYIIYVHYIYITCIYIYMYIHISSLYVLRHGDIPFFTKKASNINSNTFPFYTKCLLLLSLNLCTEVQFIILSSSVIFIIHNQKACTICFILSCSFLGYFFFFPAL